jgi:hypothetical protein
VGSKVKVKFFCSSKKFLSQTIKKKEFPKLKKRAVIGKTDGV